MTGKLLHRDASVGLEAGAHPWVKRAGRANVEQTEQAKPDPIPHEVVTLLDRSRVRG
jgi:hypothetical protein